MSLMPEIERELRRAARRLAASDHADEPATPARRHRPARARELAVTAGLVVAAGVVAGTLLLTLHHGDSAQRSAAPKPTTSTPFGQHLPQWFRAPACAAVTLQGYLPPRVGCVTSFNAPITGTQSDRVLLYAYLGRTRHPGGYVPTAYGLTLLSPAGDPVGHHIFPGPQPPLITSIANVNEQPGDELFIRFAHYLVGVYSFNGHRLVRANSASFAFRRGPGVLQDYSCLATSPPAVVQQTFSLSSRFGWRRTDIEYKWVGARLVHVATTTSPVRGAPRRAIASGC